MADVTHEHKAVQMTRNEMIFYIDLNVPVLEQSDNEEIYKIIYPSTDDSALHEKNNGTMIYYKDISDETMMLIYKYVFKQINKNVKKVGEIINNNVK
jgi:hypothetical protein